MKYFCKQNRFAHLAIVVTLCCFIFGACSNDDDDTDKNPPAPDKGTPTFSFSYSIGDAELLKYIDVTIISIDASGNQKTEKVSSFPWTQTSTTDNLPCTAGYRVKLSLKEGADLTKATYPISQVLNINNRYGVVKDNSELSGYNSTSSLALKDAATVKLILERHAQSDFFYTLNEDGKGGAATEIPLK